MGRRKGRIPARLVEDEEYQLRHERVAGIDVAKGKADVCTRLPPARGGGRRVSRAEEVTATVAGVAALAERLLADGVELVSAAEHCHLVTQDRRSRRSSTPRTGPTAQAMTATRPGSDRPH